MLKYLGFLPFPSSPVLVECHSSLLAFYREQHIVLVYGAVVCIISVAFCLNYFHLMFFLWFQQLELTFITCTQFLVLVTLSL